MRILKLFKKHILALFAAIVLIVISCNADLALPTYMSDIVDVVCSKAASRRPYPTPSAPNRSTTSNSL